MGQAFLLDSNINDGRVLITLVAENALFSGAGTLVYVNVTVNRGAIPGTFTDLTVANRGLGGLYGADLSRSTQVVQANGGVWIYTPSTLDGDNDGIRDWWVQRYFGHSTGHAYDLSRAGDDASGTGQNNLLKYLAGLDPTNSTSVFRIASVSPSGAGSFTVTWPCVASKTYKVLYADAPGGLWQEDLPNSQVTAGSGETSLSYTNTAVGTVAKRFYKIKLVP